MKKKFLAGALTAVMMMGTLTPAMVSADDMITLSLWIPTLATYSDDAVAEVQDKINEYMGEKYGIQVNLEYVEIGNFEQAINLAMTTDEFDVTC